MAATISLADDLAAVAHAAGRRNDHTNGAGRLDARGGLWQSVGGTPALRACCQCMRLTGGYNKVEYE